jgi:hypothetical protein
MTRCRSAAAHAVAAATPVLVRRVAGGVELRIENSEFLILNYTIRISTT